MVKKTIICAMGTRPEAIKMAPVVRALLERGFHAPILATAQHRGLLDQVIETFGLEVQWDLDAMTPSQNLSQLTGKILPQIDEIIDKSKPLAILAQGDTSTVLATAIAAFHSRVPFGHVEAGLRSGDLASPFPEEGNRRLAGAIARWHFAPTEGAARALTAEGVPQTKIHVVGNSVIDALLEFSRRTDLPWPNDLPHCCGGQRLILVTLHRRENFGQHLDVILETLKSFALRHPDIQLVYPVHPNPNVRIPAYKHLSGIQNVFLLEPLDYAELVHVLLNAYAVFTDSGGLQEEAPALGKPVLVFRDVTERPEAVQCGGVILVGSDPSRFNLEAESICGDLSYYNKIAQPRFPYGIGDTGIKIANILRNELL